MNSRLSVILSTKILGAVLSVMLIISGVVGAYILATDSYLWAQAPSHAYGLIAFVALDFAIAVAMFVLRWVGRIAALILPIVQLAAMAGDLYVGLGSPGSAAQSGFHEYLLNDTAFMILLVLQALLVGLAFGNMALPPADARTAGRTAADGVKVVP
jgi:hypothetical protein